LVAASSVLLLAAATASGLELNSRCRKLGCCCGCCVDCSAAAGTPSACAG
jgi:hypothetical protein